MPESTTGYGDAASQISPVASFRFFFMNGLNSNETITIQDHSTQIGAAQVPTFACFWGADVQNWVKSPHVSVGTNDPTFDNVIADMDLNELKASDDTLAKFMPAKASPIPSDVPLVMRVKSAGQADVYSFCAAILCFPIF